MKTKKQFLLNIDEKLFEQLQIQAIVFNTSCTSIINELVKNYVTINKAEVNEIIFKK